MVGSSILKALEDTKQYTITILTRSVKEHRFPPTVAVVEVDYSSFDSLVLALQGQDVLISALSKFALASERLLIDAAYTAKVKRLIPSEFGANLLNLKTRALPNYKHKVEIEEILFEMCQNDKQSCMSYTLVFNNVLLDWSLFGGLILDARNREIRKYDDGDTLFSTTRISTVGRAVAAILQNYDETANRAVYIQDIAITQNELVAIIQDEYIKLLFSDSQAASGSNSGTYDELPTEGGVSVPFNDLCSQRLVVTHVNTASMEQKARDDVSKGAPVDTLFYCFAARAAFCSEYGGYFEHTDNNLLGLKGLCREDLRGVVREALLRSTP